MPVPNLEAMSETELQAFWARYHRATRKDAEALIGDKRPRFTSITSTIANYAINKATAMQCRLRGDTFAAQGYEQICDLIYDRIPKDLRW